MFISKKLHRKGISLVLALLLSTSVFGHAWADDEEDMDEQLDGLTEQLDSLQQQAEVQQAITDQAAAKVDHITDRLKDIQLDVAEANRDYKEVAGQLNDVESRISDNTAVLAETESDLQDKRKKLNHRIREIYIHGQVSYIEVLFGSKDFSDFLTRLDLLSRIIKQDYELVMRVHHDKRVIMSAQDELEKDRADVVELVKDADNKLNRLNASKATQQALLNQAEYDKATSEEAYNDLIAASNEITNLIRSIREEQERRRLEAIRLAQEAAEAAAAEDGNDYDGDYSDYYEEMYAMPYSGDGGMSWPLYGEITSEYGWRVHPIFGTERYHSGLDIAGDYDDTIAAAAEGVVIYSGWVGGYGYTVIIDHGGGVTTLYGHNDELLVGEGEYVYQGQAVALCGSTGNSTGPHCHFEVREDGEPVNPYYYF